MPEGCKILHDLKHQMNGGDTNVQIWKDERPKGNSNFMV